MFIRDFWLAKLKQVWERVPIAWLAGVRRVGKTTLVQSLPAAECRYLNCDSPRAAEAVADPEFLFERKVAISSWFPTRHTPNRGESMAWSWNSSRPAPC